MLNPKVNNGTISIDIGIDNGVQLPISVSGGGKAVSYYDGVYELTPNADADVELPTQRKMMRENVLVHKIPYNEIQNESGTTIIIGE